MTASLTSPKIRHSGHGSVEIDELELKSSIEGILIQALLNAAPE